MDVFANALAQAVQDLKTAGETRASCERDSFVANELLEEARQNERELEELVEILTSRVTGEPRKRVPL